jgi:anaerobic selenocysteine-containing dehydrogenase
MVSIVPLLAALRTRSRFSATSVDQLPRMLVSLLLYGHQLLIPIPDIDNTDFFLIIGANPVASNGSIMTAPGIPRRIRAIQERGGRVVVVDPRRTETAAIASEHHFIRPGTDALLLMAMLNVIFEEKLARPDRLVPFTDGIQDIGRLSRGFSPERVAARTGLEAGAIRDLARSFASSPRAVAYGRVGISTQEFGTLATWLADVLNVVTGNLDRRGGALFATPAADVVTFTRWIRQTGSFASYRSRVRGLPEFGGELPTGVLAEEIETEGPGQIRALISVAGNLALSTPNGRRLEAALDGLEHFVAVDFYLNETMRHADLILPPTFGLQQDQYDLAYRLLAVRNTAKFAPPLFARSVDERHDWEILLELAVRYMARASLVERIAAPVVRRAMTTLGPRGVVDLLLRLGPHRLSVGRLLRTPHGLDLGDLQPTLPKRLSGKRIRLAPTEFAVDIGRLEKMLERPVPAAGILQLIGRRQLRNNNSWMHNSERLTSGAERCTLLMHPDDASARGLSGGQRVRVTSRVGSVMVSLEISEAIMPGVVSLPHGWGHDRPGVRLRVATAHPGASVNDLTDEALVDALAGTASFSGVPIRVDGGAEADLVI